MLQIEEWSTGKPPVLAAICLQIAFAADELLGIFSYIKNQEAIKSFPKPDPTEWLQLYRNHHRVQNMVFSSLKKFGGYPERLSQIFDTLTSKKIEQQISPSEDLKISAQKRGQEFYDLCIEDIKKDLQNEILREGSKQKIQENLINIEWLFYFMLIAPCIMWFGIHPTILYRKARQGDLKALDNLLRLDKTVLSDRKISDHYAMAWIKKDKMRLDAINRAIAGTPNFKLTRQKIKIQLAGYLSYFSELLNNRLNEQEIRFLFNAVTIDKGSSEIIDADLPNGPESFSKAIQRSRRYWKSILQPS